MHQKKKLRKTKFSLWNGSAMEYPLLGYFATFTSPFSRVHFAKLWSPLCYFTCLAILPSWLYGFANSTLLLRQFGYFDFWKGSPSQASKSQSGAVHRVKWTWVMQTNNLHIQWLKYIYIYYNIHDICQSLILKLCVQKLLQLLSKALERASKPESNHSLWKAAGLTIITQATLTLGFRVTFRVWSNWKIIC